MNVETQECYPGIAHDFEQCKKQLSDALAANELLIAENRRLREALADLLECPTLEVKRQRAKDVISKHGSQS